MEKPQKSNLYLVSEDDGHTAYLLWLVDTNDTHYTFSRNDSRPYQYPDHYIITATGGMTIDREFWLGHSELLPFKVIKVIQRPDNRLPSAPDEPTVYFVPDSE